MVSRSTFPGTVLVHAEGPSPEGLAVDLTFGMTRKNNYHYTAFLDSGGNAVVTRQELLAHFYEELSLAIMDFVDPVAGFAGTVTARVKSISELSSAIKAFEEFKRYVKYPDGYEKGLRSALSRRQDPEKYALTINLLFDHFGLNDSDSDGSVVL